MQRALDWPENRCGRSREVSIRIDVKETEKNVMGEGRDEKVGAGTLKTG